ncbi:MULTISPECIES: DUF2314 domain-containing protein [Weeksella]|uniref:DUF2314 domain-containing protein n=1 Tax=Weeksella TaxID=1013 RepID=UPI0008A38DF8|nr:MULTISPECIES: DUF2314 domain-containing protein [Weeksella]MDK7374562.1 DUF2314 domain-containing protein [Weeksella virosa]OFM83117.1 hypothetical protein HMPREF2660_02180 [Weeksella sp. HMSC059D05]
MKKTIIFAFLGLIILGSCKDSRENAVDAYKAVDKQKQEEIILDSLGQVANSSFADFRKAFAEQKEGTSNFFVKEKYVNDANREEHLWIRDITAKGDTLYGVVDSKPRVTNKVKHNDMIVIDPARISDWMYYDNGKLVGGFSLRYERSKLSVEEQKEFDEKYNVSFE